MGYHKYVFDIKKRKFLGEFEKMYQRETKEIFDSWHQEDMRQLQRRVHLAILQNYNFQSIVDLGCGKGTFVHYLKKKNNRVVGIDLSSTAKMIASSRYPDIEFESLDINDTAVLDNFLSVNFKNGIDLILGIEILSYIENWRDLLRVISGRARYSFISLDIPKNAIGFVKSERQLVSEYEKHFEIIEWLSIHKGGFTVIFGSSKKLKSNIRGAVQ